MSELLIDQELRSAPAGVVVDRQRQVAETWDYFELDLVTAAVIGGAALAMYGMDARPTESGDAHPFDTDIMSEWLEIKRIMRMCGEGVTVDFMEETGDEEEFFNHTKGKYPIDMFNGRFSYGSNPITYVTLQDALDASEVLHGAGSAGDYRVVHPDLAANGNWGSDGLKMWWASLRGTGVLICKACPYLMT